jgi:hypothetical protein
MSKKKSDNLLLIAGIGVGGYLLYKYVVAPPVATAAPVPNLTPTLTGNYSAAPTLGTGSAQTPMPSTANDPRLIEINQWISTLSAGNASAARAALTQMSQAEIAGLYDIVHNDFYGNGITTDAQRSFWNAWRVKYHVADGTYA